MRSAVNIAMLLVATAVFALLGVALGSPASSLRATLGDPLLVERVSSLSQTADYLRADDPSAVLRITEREGVVFAVAIERERPEPTPSSVADKYGVTLGMQRSAVIAKRGKSAVETMNTLLYPENRNEDASLIYRFDGDTVEAIKLVGSSAVAAGNAALPHLTEAAGDAYSTAILDVSPAVLISDHFRDRYLTVHGCDSTGRTSTIDHRGDRTYALATALCNAKKRTFYFDITRARP